MAQLDIRTRNDERLAVAKLIEDRCRDLGLSHADLVRRADYENVSKGIRRLQELLGGDLVRTKTLIDKLPLAIELPEEVVRLAIRKTQQQLDERKHRQWEAEEAEWRAAFRPHCIILTELTVPSPLFVAAAIGIEQILRVDFDTRANPISFVRLAFDGLKKKTARWGKSLPGFGKPNGFVVNYSPDFAVRFALDGKPQETFDAAYRVGQVELLRRGRPIPRGACRPSTA
jgi:hypothetical protein